MSNVIHVYVVQKRYQTPAAMETADLSRFIRLMERFASDLGVDNPTVSAPENSHSIRFEFEVGDE